MTSTRPAATRSITDLRREERADAAWAASLPTVEETRAKMAAKTAAHQAAKKAAAIAATAELREQGQAALLDAARRLDAAKDASAADPADLELAMNVGYAHNTFTAFAAAYAAL